MEELIIQLTRIADALEAANALQREGKDDATAFGNENIRIGNETLAHFVDWITLNEQQQPVAVDLETFNQIVRKRFGSEEAQP